MVDLDWGFSLVMDRRCTRHVRDSLGSVYVKPMVLYVKHAWLAEPSTP
jgi:hypothetical protein